MCTDGPPPVLAFQADPVQLRHLRYFVKIIEAGSFSRAAASIHVAQPALSQQIAELEEELGLQLLQRTPRGVKPTAAGQVLYREATAILKQVERLPGIVRSSAGEAQGTVSVGITVVLGPALTGPMIAAVRAALPKVSLKLSNADSTTITNRIESRELDLALVFEDDPTPAIARQPLFRHRLYLLSYKPIRAGAHSISMRELAGVPLILPPRPHLIRAILDRAAAAAGVSLTVAAEIDFMAMSSTAAAMKAGAGAAILPNKDLIDLGGTDWAEPLLIEPPLRTTATLVWPGDVPLTAAAEAVRALLIEFVAQFVARTQMPGVEWIGPASPPGASERAAR
jgi:LysR family transcriptional regulator, nitrogen assimilation regulatory protein